MYTKILALFIIFTITFNCEKVFCQDANEKRLERIAQQKEGVKRADVINREEIVGFSFFGGSFGTYGISFVSNFNRSNLGFFASVRGGSEKKESYKKSRGLAINAGIIKHIGGEFYFISAGGISDLTEWRPITPTKYFPNKYWEDEYKIGFENLFGVMYRHNRIIFQGGVSLQNFGNPEICFGVGYDLWRKTKLNK
jgi:hypothetical protein